MDQNKRGTILFHRYSADMKKIRLQNNIFAVVSDRDFKMVSKYHWYLHTNGYVRCSTPTKMYLHRLILSPKENELCDHINGDRLDNQRKNLRICTQSQNFMNVGKRKHNTSGFKGVCFDRTRVKWIAQIQKDGVNINIGRFEKKINAVRAYNRTALKLFGSFAYLNKI